MDLTHQCAEPAQLAAVPVHRLPPEVIGYIYSSRYWQSGRLVKLALNEFGSLWQGHGRVEAIRDWVNSRVAFTSNTSNSNTSAVDTLATIFGGVKSQAPVIRASAVADGSRGIVLPHHCREALSTDSGVEVVSGA